MIKYRQIAYLTLLTLFILTVRGQEAMGQGINVYFGTSSAVNGLDSFAPDGHSQSGYMFGADGRLNEGKMYFDIGIQFHKLSYATSEDFKLFPDGDQFNIFKLRVGLGYDLFNITDLIKIRGKTLGSIDMIGGIPETSAYTWNDGAAGVVLGLGFDVSMITFDVELEKGLFNAINKVPDSKYDFVTFAVGVIF